MEEGLPRALRVSDTLETIFSYLDFSSLDSVSKACRLWEEIVHQCRLWRKLAFSLSSRDCDAETILKDGGLLSTSHERGSREEGAHFRALCYRFHTFTHQWRERKPKETFLACSPADVNKHFGMSWEPWWQWKHQGGWLCSFALDPDSQLLLCGVIETLQVWHLPTSTCLQVLETPRSDIVEGVDIALNCLDLLGDIAISGSNEGVIRVWQVSTAKYTQRLEISEYGAVNSLKLFKSYLISGHDDGQVILWEVLSVSEVKMVKEWMHHGNNIIWGLDVNDEYLATCSEDSTVQVYETEQVLDANKRVFLEIFATLKHDDAVTHVSLLESVLASCSRDCTVMLWDLARGQGNCLVRVFRGHTQLVHYVTQDHARVYSSDDSGAVFVWDRAAVLRGEQGREKLLLKVIQNEERGATDCIKVKGAKIFTSYDDFGKIAINDFW